MEQQDRRNELTDELEHLTEEINYHLELLVTGAQELEEIDAEEQGRTPEVWVPVIRHGQIELRREGGPES